MTNVVFYRDESGNKKDAELHAEMLKSQELIWSGSPPQERAIRFAVTRLGLSLEDAKLAYA